MADEQRDATKGTKRERTRAALVAAASSVIAEDGFAAASLDAIARRAGMTKGAIYSNFRDKSELLMAVRSSRSPMLRPRFEPGATLERQLEIIAETLVRELPRIRTEARFISEYALYAQDDPDFGQAVERQYSALFDRTDDYLGHFAAQLLIPSRDLMVIIQSLTQGFVQQSFLTPRDVTPEVILAGFRSLARGVVRAGA